MSSKLAAIYGKLPWCIERSSEEYVLCTQLIKGRVFGGNYPNVSEDDVTSVF